MDFLIEIHPEDGFLGGEIRFRISRSIGKSGFRFSKSKSGFLNRTHPDRAEKRLRIRVVDSFVFDRLINEKFSPLNDVVLAGDFLAITTFDKMKLDEF